MRNDFIRKQKKKKAPPHLLDLLVAGIKGVIVVDRLAVSATRGGVATLARRWRPTHPSKKKRKLEQERKKKEKEQKYRRNKNQQQESQLKQEQQEQQQEQQEQQQEQGEYE